VSIEVAATELPGAGEKEPCHHGGDVFSQVLTARIMAADGEGVDHWELRLRSFCGECGRQFKFDLTSARPPLEPPGVVLTMRPAP